MGVGGFFTRIGLVSGSRSRPRKGRRRKAASRSVGRYLLEEPIGSGAFGEVWLAVDPHISRSVAVKILNIPKGLSARQKDEWERRFLREARAAGRLSHPGIVTIHDVGMAKDGRPFMVMELVDGASLDAVIGDRRAPAERVALEWGAQIADALDAAHRLGIVHRDVKPANVLIDKQGRARIADFGIARLAESELTREGLFVGSPAYASPEQIRGAEVDGRSDLFSLGASLYTLLCGERPFRGRDLTALAYAICHVEPVPLRRVAPRLSPACEAVVMKTLAKDPRGRYQNGQDLAGDLREVAAGRMPRKAVVARNHETTVVEPGQPGAVGADPAGPPPARRAARGGPGASAAGGTAALAIVVVMALGAGLLGSYFLTQRSAQASSRGAIAPSAGRDPWSGREARADAAVVTVRLMHGPPGGTVTIWSGQRRLLRAPVEAAPAGWRVRLPAGGHRLRVKVEDDTAGRGLEAELSESVLEGEGYSLIVLVKERPSPTLELMWTDD